MSRSLIVAIVAGALAFGLFATISLSPAGLLNDQVACEYKPGSTSSGEDVGDGSSAWRHSRSGAKANTGAVAAHGVAGSSSDKHEEKMLIEALRKKPDHVPVLLRMAGLAAAQRQFDKAIEHLNQASRHEPKNVEVRLELGRMLFETGKIAEAIEQTQAILKDNPGNTEALYNLGAIYGNVGNREMAEKYWGRLIAAKPESEADGAPRCSS